MGKWILSMVVAALGLLTAVPAHAGWTFTGTSGDDIVYIGLREVSPGVRRVYACDESGTPTWVALDNSNSQLTDSLSVIDMDAGNDELHIINLNFPESHCGETMYGLVYNTYTLTIIGGSGDDTITGGEGIDQILGDQGTVSACQSASSLGSTGNRDNLDGYYGNDLLYGCNGQDIVQDDKGTYGDTLQGNEDIDCLEATPQVPGSYTGTVDCGNGNDRHAVPAGVPAGTVTSCERVAASC